MKKTWFTTTVALIVISQMIACAPAAKEEIESRDKRIADLERQLDGEQRKRGEAETLRSEVEKHQARILQCHRDFRGSYGRLIQKSVHLVRGTARTLRYDCQGALKKDAIETVSDPRESLELPELKDLVGQDATVIVMNRQTCQGGGFSKGLTRWSTPSLWVDRANAVFTHEVFAGLNQIDFGLCDASGKSKTISKDCAHPTWVATLELKVTEEEKLDAKTRDIRPQAAECAAKTTR